jgi:hypothetical protein
MPISSLVRDVSRILGFGLVPFDERPIQTAESFLTTIESKMGLTA